MTKQLLIYEQLAPLNSERHRDWSVKTGNDFRFASEVSSVPLTAVEFREAATEFPIVFAEAGDNVVPVAIMGIRAEENLYFEENGSMSARYIPAFLRRYPFIFSTSKDGKTFSLCIDESFDGCNQEGRGERLFDTDGERTQYLKSVLGFQQEYQAQFSRTQAFCSKLQDLELLEPMTATLGMPDGPPASLTGFMGIERKKINGLPAETLHELAQSGELELAYIHLQSLANFRHMIQKTSSIAPEAGTSDEQESPDKDEDES